jgi:3-oxoacyl-[acyl-carrier protein] reductase
MESRQGCALVTGGSRGIGAEIAVALAESGWPVAVNYRSDRAGAAATAGRIEAAGSRALLVCGDVTGADAPEQLFTTVQEELGKVLVLVNNAGIRMDGLSPQLKDEHWQRVIDTNLTAPFRMVRQALMQMIRSRFGRIINIASIVGMRANAGQANYAAAKAGLVAMTKTVAAEVGRRGITVNAIAPGLIESDMTRDLHEGLAGIIPARRFGLAAEVAACARFLASEEASYVNGAVLTVDGGLSA